MQLEDIEEENNKFLKKAQKEEQQKQQEKEMELETPKEELRHDLLIVEQPKLEQRRGSNLLASAGIDYERRRKQHSGGGVGESRIFQEGDQWMEEKDGKITKLEIIEVKEKMGNMRKAVPTLPVPIAIFLCLLNVILPGIGSFVGASTLLCCGKCRHELASTGVKYGIVAGIIQVLLTPLIVGWIFSIYYGVNIVQDSISRAAYKTEVNITTETGTGVEEEVVEKPPPTDGNKTQAWV